VTQGHNKNEFIGGLLKFCA